MRTKKNLLLAFAVMAGIIFTSTHCFAADKGPGGGGGGGGSNGSSGSSGRGTHGAHDNAKGEREFDRDTEGAIDREEPGHPWRGEDKEFEYSNDF